MTQLPREDRNLIVGLTAWQDARYKAMYGHKDWICWIENETQHASRLNAETLKRAMLAEGTHCRLVEYGDGGWSFIVNWSIACIMLRNIKRGCI